MAIVLQTSAVNFDLLSETEQLAIIGAFAALLNSLSFSIQIVIRSKRLDISNYLNLLRDAEQKQKNPLLQLMMQHYRQFVTNIIRNNEVLDKQFYVVLSVSALELGVVKNVDKNFEKGLTLLTPRRDNLIRQLGRIGLKTTQLNTDKLIALFYDYYNDTFKSSLKTTAAAGQQTQTISNLGKTAPAPGVVQQTPPQQPQPAQTPSPAPAAPSYSSNPSIPSINPSQSVQTAPQPNSQLRPLSRNVPFAVEELPA